jgi:hypothetical protein
MQDGVPAQRGVGLHDLEFLRFAASRFGQNAAGNADFVDGVLGRDGRSTRSVGP